MPVPRDIPILIEDLRRNRVFIRPGQVTFLISIVDAEPKMIGLDGFNFSTIMRLFKDDVRFQIHV